MEYPIEVYISECLSMFSSGSKSVDSITRKIDKLAPNAPAGDINDLVRATLIVPDYRAIPSLVQYLKNKIPILNAYIKRQEVGYIGLHGRFMFEGFQSEIQFTTPLGKEAKTFDDERYHRIENLNKEQRYLESLPVVTIETLQRKSEIQKEKNYYNAMMLVSKQKFENAYTQAGLYENLDKITAIFLWFAMHGKSVTNYELDILNSTDRSPQFIQKLADAAAEVQYNFEQTLTSFTDYKAHNLEIPQAIMQLNEIKAFVLKQLRKEKLKLSENELDMLAYSIVLEYAQLVDIEKEPDLYVLKQIYLFRLGKQKGERK